jgi:hypothetical protein
MFGVVHIWGILSVAELRSSRVLVSHIIESKELN